MTSYENVRYEVDGFIATITIAREKALNALNRHTLNEISWALREADGDARVRCVILTGAGEKAFVAGADISEMVEQGATEARGFAQAGRAVGDVLESMTKPVIAAVNGFALGGGCELALACDFIYCSDKARFGQPEVNLGVIPGFGGTQRLSRRVGLMRAKEIVFTGDMIDAAQAKAMGLALEVVPAERLLPYAIEKARKIASRGPLGVAQAKRAMEAGAGVDLATGCALEVDGFGLLFSTEDARE